MEKQLLNRLPIVITGNYTCYEAVLMDIPIIILALTSNDNTPMQLRKHQQIVERLTGSHAVVAMESVASYRISRMIVARVNFIIPDKLIYIPSLMLNLKEVKDGRRLDEEVMPGMAQCVLLYHLQRENLNGQTTKHLADKFRTSYAGMNRALRWLNLKGFAKMEGVKEKTLLINYKGKELWEKTSTMMPSPVERVFYSAVEFTMQPLAGESALEYFTMISAPERLCRAVSKEWIQNKKALLNKYDGDFVVEVWRYDPKLLAKDGVIDTLSLYLSMRTNDDERIRIELNKLKNGLEWLED